MCLLVKNNKNIATVIKYISSSIYTIPEIRSNYNTFLAVFTFIPFLVLLIISEGNKNDIFTRESIPFRRGNTYFRTLNI